MEVGGEVSGGKWCNNRGETVCCSEGVDEHRMGKVERTYHCV